ncbi:SDR family oxidoreductase [Rhodobacteraceae bacterium NNCM2]|nr:SDR family oxidoreductase [Coraliihabitans acroporae]
MKPGKALLTGASQRLGRAMALALAADGWDIAIHYNGSKAKAEETAGEIRALGRAAITLQADLDDVEQTKGLVSAAGLGLGGPLTLLINNASTFENDHIENMTPTSWDRSMGSNLRAPVQLVQDFAAQAPEPEIDANGEPVAAAVVINMLDQRLLKPTPEFMSYILAKSALHMFTQTAAQALGPRIRVCGIGPGPTIAAENQRPSHFAMQRRACLLGRGSDPEDIVMGMRFILACKAYTGQMLAIDGGQHLVWQTPDVVGEPG